MTFALSYYGGKQRLASKIVSLMPQHTVYVEPFCGGASIFFAKPWPNVTNFQHYREVINDHDKRLINFYKQLRDNGQKMVDRLLLTPYSEEEHHLARDMSGDDVEAACRYFTNLQQGFSNVLNSGWKRAAFGAHLGLTWFNKIQGLSEILERMIGVHISCDDALTVIKQWDSPQTFFYCDPPYPEAVQGHYDGYSITDFQNLVSTLNECQGSFLLSNYDQPEVEIPHDWERFEFDAYCTSSCKGRVNMDRSAPLNSNNDSERKRTEIVWRRFNSVPVRSDIQALYDSGRFNCFVSKDQNAMYEEW